MINKTTSSRCAFAVGSIMHTVYAATKHNKQEPAAPEQDGINYLPVFGIAAALMGYLVYSSKQNNAGDLVVVGNEEEEKPKKRKSKSKKQYHKKLDDEFFTALEKAGPFEADETGLIPFEQLIKLLEAINFRAFSDNELERQVSFNTRIDDLKNKRGREYMSEVMKGREDFQDVFAKVKHDALTYTDISEDSFNSTMTKIFNDRKKMREISLMESRLMNEVQKTRDTTLSKDVLKKIYTDRLKSQFMAEQSLPNDQNKKVNLIIEDARILDSIYIKYDLTQLELHKAVADHQLDLDPEIVHLKTYLCQCRAERAGQPAPVPDLKYWQEDIVKLSISKIGELEPLNAQRILPFNTFQKIRFLLAWLTVHFIDIEQAYYKTERRKVFD